MLPSFVYAQARAVEYAAKAAHGPGASRGERLPLLDLWAVLYGLLRQGG